MFFFFKQKTAYEMRISDWSSDVCSSDLGRSIRRTAWRPGSCDRPCQSCTRPASACSTSGRCAPHWKYEGTLPSRRCRRATSATGRRSEEHTSELQSLMRISYAVFCLKKKNYTYQHITYPTCDHYRYNTVVIHKNMN